MQDLVIVIANQEYNNANHKMLWNELADSGRADVLVMNISADFVITLLRHKQYRLKEALSGVRSISNHLFVMRPYFLVRPEIFHGKLQQIIAHRFWRNIDKKFSAVKEYKKITILAYDALWVKLLWNTRANLNFAYYLFDEVRLIASTGKMEATQYALDEYACQHSNVVFTMTDTLKHSRENLNQRVYTIGNGAPVPSGQIDRKWNFAKAVAFVGVFRDWIDMDLLSGLIRGRTDLDFCFVGTVESNMEQALQELAFLPNVHILGKVAKEKMESVYRSFGCVIVPYKQNSFIGATRPIKIVEAVIAGTPVVTVPMSGYEENSFIRFAKNLDEFSKQIDYVLQHPIKIASEEYIAFINENTWRAKASLMLDHMGIAKPSN